MFFSTKSIGVRRLSVILGLVAGFCFIIALHEPTHYGAPGETPAQHWHIIGINILNMTLLFAVGFIAAWFVVRVIAWVIAGFALDHSNKS